MIEYLRGNGAWKARKTRAIREMALKELQTVLRSNLLRWGLNGTLDPAPALVPGPPCRPRL